MKPHIPPPGIGAQIAFERNGARRGDGEFLKARFGDASAFVLALCDLRVPILPSPDRQTAELCLISARNALLRDRTPHDFIYLGERQGAPLFALNIAPCDPESPAALSRLHPLADLRSLALQGVLPQEDLMVAAQARALLAWRDATRCCGRCGARVTTTDGGWRLRCSACLRDHYPRTDPAVIMLITRGDLCLMGHEHRFPQGLYSTLAGFVEPGDDIEHAVRREVLEESGIEVGAVRYVASQPWPFPHSLMIGCWGEALTSGIRIDTTELGDVRWFTRDELYAMIDGRHPDGLFVPPPISMAHTLIRGFLSGALG
jgi:NAD+ diphosphatase